MKLRVGVCRSNHIIFAFYANKYDLLIKKQTIKNFIFDYLFCK
jgi:hypothetical protein